MAKTSTGSSLRRLCARAVSDDRAWHDLLERLAPDVERELARHGLEGDRAEPARRATWRSLGRRLQLGPPEDVASWIRQRAAIEAHLSAVRRSPRDVSSLRVERRRSPRRSVERPHSDRRSAVAPPRTPDALAAELLSSRGQVH